MIALLKLELAKLRHARFFKVLLIIWLVSFVILPLGTQFGLLYLSTQVTAPDGFNFTAESIPLFDFVDVWQNLGSTYRYISIFLGILVVISITDEYRNKTIRQNILDGLSRKEYLISKITLAAWLSVVTSLALLVMGLIMGFIASPVKDIASILHNMPFVLGFTLHLFTFLLFCMTIATLIKRSGLSIGFILFWTFIFDFGFNVYFLFKGWDWARYLLPTEAAWRVVPNGFQRMLLVNIESELNPVSVLMCLVWSTLLIWAMWGLVSKRDLT